MGINIDFDLEGLSANILQTGARCVDGVIDTMREGGEDIRDLAKSYAPVENEGLEEAIKSETRSGGRTQLGRFSRKHIEVYVDPDMPELDEFGNPTGRSVGRYAAIMHEALAPYGSGLYELGERSKRKASSHDVGGKYLERAAEDLEGEIANKAFNRVKKVLGGI